MKVLHVIPSISPALGGPTQVVLNLVKSLRHNGVDAEVVTTNDNGATLLDVPLFQRTEYEQVPVWFLPRFSPPMKEFIFSPTITRWLWQNVRNYDILDNHYLFSYAPTCAGAIARWQNVPYTVRTMGQLEPWALEQSKQKKQIYSLLIERRNLQKAAAIHCTSAGEAEDVRNFGIKTSTVTIPLGVNPSEVIPDAIQKLHKKYGISEQTPIILFLSRLHYKKRPDLLLNALSQLKVNSSSSTSPNFHLIIAGSGEETYITYLKDLVQSLDLSKSTTFAGFVTGIDKEILLQGSDIFVLPSFSENFGIAVAEAMAASLPVIITPGVQIAPEIAQARAGRVVNGEVEALSFAISELLESRNLRAELSENGKRLVKERYSWSAIAKELTSVYSEIIHAYQP